MGKLKPRERQFLISQGHVGKNAWPLKVTFFPRSRYCIPDRCPCPSMRWHKSCHSQVTSSGLSRRGTCTVDCRYHYLWSWQPPPEGCRGTVGSLEERDPASLSLQLTSILELSRFIMWEAGLFPRIVIHKGPTPQSDFWKCPSALKSLSKSLLRGSEHPGTEGSQGFRFHEHEWLSTVPLLPAKVARSWSLDRATPWKAGPTKAPQF